MLKLVLGITGLVLGGWAGFLIVGLGPEIIIPAEYLEPGSGYGMLVAAVFIGIPVVGAAGCYFAILCASRISAKR